MRAVEGLFAGPLISLHGSACTETEPAILIAVIIWRHYIGESGGKISSRSCDYLCSGWEPSRPYGPVDSGSLIWDSHWPLATGIITGWAGSYTEARLEQQLKSSLSHRPVPALRIGGGWGGRRWVLPWRLGKGYLFGGSVCPASVAPVRHRVLRPTRQPLRGNYIHAKEVAL